MEKGLQANKGKEPFVFYDGPPFATGLPHYGHLLAGTLKDVVPRYWTMKGYSVPRRFGWDCHGLPVEHEINKTLNVKSNKDVHAMGVQVADCVLNNTWVCVEQLRSDRRNIEDSFFVFKNV